MLEDFRDGLVDVDGEIDWFSVLIDTKLNVGIDVDIVFDSTGGSIPIFENSSSAVSIIWVIVVVVSGDVLDKICNVGSIDVEIVSVIVVGCIVWDVVISVIVRVGSVMKAVSDDIDDCGVIIVDEWNVGSDLSVVVDIVSNDEVIISNVVVGSMAVDNAVVTNGDVVDVEDSVVVVVANDRVAVSIIVEAFVFMVADFSVVVGTVVVWFILFFALFLVVVTAFTLFLLLDLTVVALVRNFIFVVLGVVLIVLVI
jgi:hypothetical protein